MSFRRWSSVLEHQQLLNMTLYASMLPDELDDRDAALVQMKNPAAAALSPPAVEYHGTIVRKTRAVAAVNGNYKMNWRRLKLWPLLKYTMTLKTALKISQLNDEGRG